MRRSLVVAIFTTGFTLFFAFVTTLPDGKLHVIFCNVGQGDAVYIRFADGRDMLIDGGPSQAVLSCLGSHMPFWDRSLDVVVMTHPQKDHFGGLTEVFMRYTVHAFVLPDVNSDTEEYSKLLQAVHARDVPIRYVGAGDRISVGPTFLTVLWPDRRLLSYGRDVGLSHGTHDRSEALGAMTLDDNIFSLVLRLTYGTFDALFTGDADMQVEREYLQTISPEDTIEVLKVPHHGSKTALSGCVIARLKPDISVFSVGANNYGHPAESIISLFRQTGSRVLRTDTDGHIEIVSDGRTWYVR